MSVKINYTEDRAKLFYVLADGKFHQVVPENTEGAVKREYETSDGKKGTKWEILADSLEGQITNLSLFDGDFGKNVMILFGDVDPKNNVIVSLAANSNYGEDFMKILPNIDIAKPVKLTPYSFENDKGKMIKGLQVKQDDNKLFSHYHDYNEKTKKSAVKNGYPKLPSEAEIKSKSWDQSEDWKAYFAKARKFLIKELQDHIIFIDDLKQAQGQPEDSSKDKDKDKNEELEKDL